MLETNVYLPFLGVVVPEEVEPEPDELPLVVSITGLMDAVLSPNLSAD